MNLRQILLSGANRNIESENTATTKFIEAGELCLDTSRILGKGYTSIVLEGTQGDHTVACKIFAPDTSDAENDLRLKFDQEIELLKKVSHPHLPKYYKEVDTFFHDQLVHGFTREIFASSVIEAISPKSTLELSKMITQVASALDYLYTDLGILLPDLSPDNLMQRHDGTYVISDLNLTSDGKSHPTEFSDGFVAPEVADVSTSSFDQRAEVYSLAVTAYQILGGEVDSDEFGNFGISINQNQNISDELLEVLIKATSFNPSDRYATPTEFAKAFEASLSAKL